MSTDMDLRTCHARYLPDGYERASAGWRDAQAFKARLVAEERRGDIRIEYPFYRTLEGSVHVTYERLRPARREVPRWLVPVALFGAVAVAIGTAGYFAMKAVESTVDAVTHPTGVGVGLLVILGLLLLAKVGGGRIVEGTFRARVK